MKRRRFLNSTLSGSVLAALHLHSVGLGDASAEAEEENTMTEPGILDLDATPIFCAHEHWGSIPAVGMADEGFRGDVIAGAEPEGPVSVWDIVLDPYFGGGLYGAGYDAQASARQAGFDSFNEWWRKAPLQALESISPALREQCLTGAFQCIREGVAALHGADLGAFSLEDWQRADLAVARAYEDMFGWYRSAMERLNISALVRPVHPEYFWREASKADEERSFTRPILRIDPLLELWQETCTRRDALAEMTGVYPADAASWRDFITALFDRAAALGNVGIKQLQAYTRSLDFVPRAETEVVFSGALDSTQRRIFQDWVVHECCKQAHVRHWPHQVHVGTHNLEASSPLPLAALARRYPDMKVVLLHCWPFLEESAFLVKTLPNVYLDACWQVILNPAFLTQSLETWLGYLPASRMMFSQDATSVEMAAGSAIMTRRRLGEALSRLGTAHRIPETHLYATAADMLHNNGVRWYGAGKSVEA